MPCSSLIRHGIVRGSGCGLEMPHLENDQNRNMCGSTHHYHLMFLMFEWLNLSLDDAVLVEVGWNTFSSSKNFAKCIWWVK